MQSVEGEIRLPVVILGQQSKLGLSRTQTGRLYDMYCFFFAEDCWVNFTSRVVFLVVSWSCSLFIYWQYSGSAVYKPARMVWLVITRASHARGHEFDRRSEYILEFDPRVVHSSHIQSVGLNE